MPSITQCSLPGDADEEFVDRDAVFQGAAAEVLVETLGVQVVAFSQEQRPVTIRMLLEEQRILFEEPDPRPDSASRSTRARVRRVEHADVVAEGDLAERARAPSQVGVLAERHVELLVEPVDGVEDVPPQQQVRGHEADALEADVGHGAVVRVVDPLGDDEPFHADHTRRRRNSASHSAASPARAGSRRR